MHWPALIVLCTILFTIVIANPITKLSSKQKNTKHIALHKRSHANTVVIESKVDALKFFTQFGYTLCKNPPGSKVDDHDSPACQSSMESMLEVFQITFHLPVTKKLDDATLKLMNTPRCSLSDFPQSFIDKGQLW